MTSIWVDGVLWFACRSTELHKMVAMARGYARSGRPTYVLRHGLVCWAANVKVA